MMVVIELAQNAVQNVVQFQPATWTLLPWGRGITDMDTQWCNQKSKGGGGWMDMHGGNLAFTPMC